MGTVDHSYTGVPLAAITTPWHQPMDAWSPNFLAYLQSTGILAGQIGRGAGNRQTTGRTMDIIELLDPHGNTNVLRVVAHC
jgi:hypothetical protein